MYEQRKVSHFNRDKNASVRGIKGGAIELMRCQDGGFIRVPRPNSRLKLARLLEQNSDVKQVIDRYKSMERPTHYKNSIVPFDDLREREKEREKQLLLESFHNNGNIRLNNISPCDINDQVKKCSLNLLTRSQIHHSQHWSEIYDSAGNTVLKKKPKDMPERECNTDVVNSLSKD